MHTQHYTFYFSLCCDMLVNLEKIINKETSRKKRERRFHVKDLQIPFAIGKFIQRRRRESTAINITGILNRLGLSWGYFIPKFLLYVFFWEAACAGVSPCEFFVCDLLKISKHVFPVNIIKQLQNGINKYNSILSTSTVNYLLVWCKAFGWELINH